MNNYVVYAHISPSNKYYVGITCRTLHERWGNNGSRYETHQVFQRAIEKYGWDNIQHVILAKNLTREQAVQLEKFFIRKYKSNNPKLGYNGTEGGDGIAGYRHTPQTKQKLKDFWNQPEQKKFARDRAIGHITSEETKKKISESMKKTMTPERIEFMRQISLGKVMSQDAKEKLRQANLGKKMSKEARLKMSEVSKGKKRHTTPHTQETKDKIRQKLKNKFVSQETREKLRQKALLQWKRTKEETQNVCKI